MQDHSNMPLDKLKAERKKGIIIDIVSWKFESQKIFIHNY